MAPAAERAAPTVMAAVTLVARSWNSTASRGGASSAGPVRMRRATAAQEGDGEEGRCGSARSRMGGRIAGRPRTVIATVCAGLIAA